MSHLRRYLNTTVNHPCERVDSNLVSYYKDVLSTKNILKSLENYDRRS
jgi:hypothetical protein